ncbi:transporter substrate-binding domain-containing protein [Legionella anisa]|uniref:ABC transporter substrate-binding protein n=1 Tax=Legionella anisa TaxID=28082 RepID=A0AAX0WUZ2_9GAMM|nr:transporter substrate-binding domain-containing protein [Legionella anisa]AWN73864.1 ABC transporter substrate-binding protein [Legionella anisa]KTC67129.1 amino acid binding protein [Legionella anisa]MBN5936312.1 transporter substrate-binding domain-containing protein [Legionella anisa]MCW8426124.1 transporter substrate-binding domain-containing protein [Legionella anisa]MCW8448435.1 transporter substrate-binding domain-containing protein [Legionella anisa]
MKLIKYIVFITLLFNSFFAYCDQLIVGVLKFAPPFASQDANNHYFGFSIDLMNEICKRINATCTYKGTDLNSQFKDLNDGVIDITTLPSPISSTELDDYVFSLPYITSRGQFMVLESSNIDSIEDLKDKKIGALQATSFQYNILPNYTSKENIKTYSQVTALIQAVSNGKVDAALMNEHVAKYLLLNKTIDGFKLLGKPIVTGNGYGIIALKKNAPIIDKINKALLQIETDGTYLTLYNKYFGD